MLATLFETIGLYLVDQDKVSFAFPAFACCFSGGEWESIDQ
jgi:hypothetical protein